MMQYRNEFATDWLQFCYPRAITFFILPIIIFFYYIFIVSVIFTFIISSYKVSQVPLFLRSYTVPIRGIEPNHHSRILSNRKTNAQRCVEQTLRVTSLFILCSQFMNLETCNSIEDLINLLVLN